MPSHVHVAHLNPFYSSQIYYKLNGFNCFDRVNIITTFEHQLQNINIPFFSQICPEPAVHCLCK